MRRKALIVAGLVLAGALAALAQTTPLYNLIGTETTLLTLGSGSQIAEPINGIRNTQGILTVGAATQPDTTPTAATAMAIATGAITTWNVWLPNPAYHGHEFCVANGTGATLSSNVSVSTGVGFQTQAMAQTFNSQSLSAGAAACFVYNGPNGTSGTWFRFR